MSAPHPFAATRQTFTSSGKSFSFFSLPALARTLGRDLSTLPVSLRIVLESVLRNCDGTRVTPQAVHDLAGWQPNATRTAEIPFIVARIVLQDFTGVPLLVDLAAMRAAVDRLGRNPKLIEPLVPVDLVVDHSVQVDYTGAGPAFALNLQLEFQRNRERYQFLKWGRQAFETFKVVPPGIGIVHQVNLEYLAQGVLTSESSIDNRQSSIVYPDTLVGTDSHTTMINGLGIVGWGVGGIEAEAGMLGQPVYFLTPDVVGVHLTGKLREGTTATDLVLRVTELLRQARVVGKFVEFYGPGAAALPVTDRATIANMAPEYGATMGFFPVDDACIDYMRATGRAEQQCALFADYFKAQGLFGIPARGQIHYSKDLDLDLASVEPSVAGPKRPQDRINLSDVGNRFAQLFSTPKDQGGFGKQPGEITFQVPLKNSYAAQTLEAAGETTLAAEVAGTTVGHGSVLIAAITSCTNTSNPSVMLAAGLLAKKAVERGLTINPGVKCSLAPGSRVVSDYLQQAGLQTYLDQLGFNLVGYGCTTCIGNSGPLAPAIEEAITNNDLIAASVLSGNRNFEARVHPNLKANFLMSPPLVVAFALAGTVCIDLANHPLGKDRHGNPVFLKDLWPSLGEIRALMASALKPAVFRALYSDFEKQNPAWNDIPSSDGHLYEWDTDSTYIQEPPFFTDFSLDPGTITPITRARPLGIFGDSVTTDHISPAGSIKKDSPAGKYLVANGIDASDFNSYGSRRGNDRVMTRGTFANVRIKNLMCPGTEGGITRYFKSQISNLKSESETLPIFDAAQKYARDGVPLVIIGGKEYGTGSSRDWAAKGTRLLGVRAVITESFERIHRSNLVGMGVLPCCFPEGTNAQTLRLDGSETFSLRGLGEDIQPQQQLTLEITRANGTVDTTPVTCRIDTPIEVEYYRHGGILPYVLRQILARQQPQEVFFPRVLPASGAPRGGRVNYVISQVRAHAEPFPGTPARKKSPAKKKTAPKKKAARKPAAKKKASVKKASVKKASVKKASVKKASVKKASVKKAAPKKKLPTKKKVSTRKPVKKTSARKKLPAKKKPAAKKKTVVRKTTRKKSRPSRPATRRR